MPLAICPTREELLDYVVGKLPDEASDSLADHLESCADCQAGLATLPDPEDTLIAGLRQPVALDPYQQEPKYEEAMARAKAVIQPPENRGPSSPGSSSTFLPRQLGEYQLRERLGCGGMGTVYKALQTKLDRVVAVKILPRSRNGDPRAITRFEREMKAIGRLSHPNIVQAHDAREIDDMPVLIMEFIDGLDLSELVRRVGQLPVAEACELVRRTALALQYAHEHGLVHRDIKPSNIMLSKAGEVKLLDLGLARFFESVSHDSSGATGILPVQSPDEMTNTGQAMGTADYMAPEQASDSRSVDIRADIYSLGCTLYKLLSGRVPFTGPEYRGTLDKMNAHVRETPPSLHEFVPDLPEELVKIVERMLAKNPADRCATPVEVAEALKPFTVGQAFSLSKERRDNTSSRQVGNLPHEANLPELISNAIALPPECWAKPEKSRDANFITPHPATAPTRRRPIVRNLLIGMGFLGAIALSFVAGILITIKKDNQVNEVSAPPGTRTTIDEQGNATVEFLGESKKEGVPPSTIDLAAKLQPLQGQWKVVKVDKGKDVTMSWAYQSPDSPEFMTFFNFHKEFSETIIPTSLTIEGFVPLTLPHEREFHFVYRINPKTNPKTIDLFEYDSSRRKIEELAAVGIYEISGNRLKFCLAKYESSLEGNIQRPKEFSATPGSAVFYLERYTPSEDETAIQGLWRTVSQINDGTPLDESRLRISTCIFHNPGFKFMEGSKEFGGQYQLNNATEPKEIHLTSFFGPAGRVEKSEFHGIYKFDGDRLIIAFSKGDKPPEKFESTPGSGVVLLELKRSEPEKKSAEKQEGVPLAQAIKESNAKLASNPALQNPRPITEHEVITVVRDVLASDYPPPRTASEGLKSIVDSRKMPAGFHLEEQWKISQWIELSILLKYPLRDNREDSIIIRSEKKKASPSYSTAKITRGDITATISASGTILPEKVVDVHAFVSGPISEIVVDYNSPVERNQLLAKIDSEEYKSRLISEEAGLEGAKAKLRQAEAKAALAKSELENAKQSNQKVKDTIPQSELNKLATNDEVAQAAVEEARANVKQSENAVQAAKKNLAFTSIICPIKGIVLKRLVNGGQSVEKEATLFQIAKEFDKMQIETYVNVKEMRRIHEGMESTFTVDAFPQEVFKAKVKQIQLSEVRGDYPVILTFDNPERKLLPFMAATVRFEVEKQANVLLVPNAALQWKPAGDEIAVAPVPNKSGRQRIAFSAPLWVKSEASDRVRGLADVQLGPTDGNVTEVSGSEVKEGMEVIVGDDRPTETPFKPVEQQPWNPPAVTPTAPNPPTATPTPSGLPHVVPFKIGATRFENGDQITIEEVRGTADTVKVDNVYEIKGTYRLASHEKAVLAAFVTVDGSDPKARQLKNIPAPKTQYMTVERGEGKFSLVMKMWCEGKPHLSFYAGSESIGSVYFGTGDSVLYHSKQEDNKNPPKNEPPPAATPAQTVNPAAELKALQGDWKTVQQDSGEAVDPMWLTYFNAAKISRLIFQNQYVEVVNFEIRAHVNLTFRIDPATTPKSIDMLEQGEKGQLAAIGIYEFDGDKLKICLTKYQPSLKNNQRPTDFSLAPKSGDTLLTLERYRPSEDEKTLQGSWTIVSKTENGKVIAEEQFRDFSWGFKDCFVRISENEPGASFFVYSSPLLVDENKKPKKMTIYSYFDFDKHKNIQLHSIYKFDGKSDGGRLTIAFRQSGPAPDKFESTPGSGVTVLELKRSEPKPATEATPTPDDSKAKSDQKTESAPVKILFTPEGKLEKQSLLAVLREKAALQSAATRNGELKFHLVGKTWRSAFGKAYQDEPSIIVSQGKVYYDEQNHCQVEDREAPPTIIHKDDNSQPPKAANVVQRKEKRGFLLTPKLFAEISQGATPGSSDIRIWDPPGGFRSYWVNPRSMSTVFVGDEEQLNVEKVKDGGRECYRLEEVSPAAAVRSVQYLDPEKNFVPLRTETYYDNTTREQNKLRDDHPFQINSFEYQKDANSGIWLPVKIVMQHFETMPLSENRKPTLDREKTIEFSDYSFKKPPANVFTLYHFGKRAQRLVDNRKGHAKENWYALPGSRSAADPTYVPNVNKLPSDLAKEWLKGSEEELARKTEPKTSAIPPEQPIPPADKPEESK